MTVISRRSDVSEIEKKQENTPKNSGELRNQPRRVMKLIVKE
jgi:hypothetical protein